MLRGAIHRTLQVAATEGIMRIHSAEELEGVMAQELAHMQNHDKLISTIAAGYGLAFDARCSQGIDRIQR